MLRGTPALLVILAIQLALLTPRALVLAVGYLALGARLAQHPPLPLYANLDTFALGVHLLPLYPARFLRDALQWVPLLILCVALAGMYQHLQEVAPLPFQMDLGQWLRSINSFVYHIILTM